ncbi:helix-turn-helix transcriptional regulator [Dactylosporangium sp. CA-139114]|uniref:helix-turn-helix transcriptional regulator n=1 Tax=Dactylosporangium sp. CA-139114 TaxID=3239931 RepID=UPI003D981E7B
MAESLRFYTYKEAAALLGISESKLRKDVANGLISCHRSAGGRLVRFTEDDLRTAFKPVPATSAVRAIGRRRSPRRRPR